MSDAAVSGLVDRDGRLVEAGGPLDELNRRAGGELGQSFAVPQVAMLARLAQRLGIPVSRHVLAADGPDEVELWVVATPVDAGVKLAISGWRVRAPWTPPADTARRDRDLLLPGADWAWETDATLHLTAIGAEAARQGVEPAGLLGQPLDALMTPTPDGQGAMPMFAVLLAHGPFDDQPAKIRSTGATVILSARPRLDTGGKFAGYIGSARAAATPPVTAEPDGDALTEAFSARLDRALRAPLGRIIANADSINAQTDGPVRQDYVDYAADIASAGRHLMTLVDDLVDLQAIERPDFAVAAEGIDLADIGRRAAGLLSVRAAERGVRIDKPQEADRAPATGEFKRVLQILVNLIGNAVRYSPDGGMVWVRTHRDRGASVIIVADQGKGIAPEDQARIFDKFERVDPTEPGGSGLGLYIARRLARAMGGELSVDSAPGEGGQVHAESSWPERLKRAKFTAPPWTAQRPKFPAHKSSQIFDFLGRSCYRHVDREPPRRTWERVSMSRRIRTNLICIAMACMPCVAPAAGASAGPVEIARGQDLDAFANGFLAKDRSAPPSAVAAQRAKLAALRASAATMTDAEFFLALAEIVALSDNGHTLIGFGEGQTIVTRRLPLVLADFKDAGLVILRAQEPYGDIAGASIISFDGHPVTEVFSKFRLYFGGTDFRRSIMLQGLLTAGGMLQAAGFASSDAHVVLGLVKRDGTRVSRQVDYIAPKVPAPATASWPSRWWSPEPIAGDTRQWVTAIPNANLPLYLQQADQFFRIVPLPELRALYVQMRTNETKKGLAAFVADAEKQILQAKPKNLVVDMRFNKGGDMRVNADLMRRLPSMVPADGHVYVITGRYTFSAGMTAVALIVKNGGSKVTLVGEPVGDRLRFWSEWEVVCTPNTHICVQRADNVFDLAKGCAGEPACFVDNRTYDMVVGSLEPQIKAPTTAADYFAGRDPTMEAIRADIARVQSK